MALKVSFTDILLYVGAGTRAYEEGERVLNANHLMYCAVRSRTSEKVNIIALCLQSSALHSKPHELSFEIKVATPKISGKCSCKAGLSGICKHSVALLMHINRVGLEALETASCTDVTQQWGRIKKLADEEYSAQPIETFCHFKRRKSYAPHEDPFNKNVSMDTYLGILIKGADSSELERLISCRRTTKPAMQPVDLNESTKENLSDLLVTLFSMNSLAPLTEDTVLYREISEEGICNDIGVRNLEPHVQEFYNDHVCVSLERALDLCSKTRLQKGNTWLEERKKRISASVAYSFYTYSKGTKQDWFSKIDNHLNSKFMGNAHLLYGLKMESKARTMYGEKFMCEVQQLGFIVNPNVPWVGYSPDGIVGISRLIEIKCPTLGKTLPVMDVVAKLPYVKNGGENYYLHKKHQYYGQVQLGMAITGIQYCDLVIFSAVDNDIFVINVQFDPKFVFEEFLPQLQKVYFKYLLPRLSELLK